MQKEGFHRCQLLFLFFGSVGIGTGMQQLVPPPFLHSHKRSIVRVGSGCLQLLTTAIYQCIESNGSSDAPVLWWDRHLCSSGIDQRQECRDDHRYLYVPLHRQKCDCSSRPNDEKYPRNLWGMIWIDVESNPSPGCGWSLDKKKTACF